MPGSRRLTPIDARNTSMVIADQIRDRIIDGSYAPGEQINEANVAAELEISRGPVREALQRLNQEGLLVSYRNRGVFVVELSSGDVAEIYQSRAAIEVGAAWTLVHGDRAQLIKTADELSAIVMQMQPFIDRADWRGLAERDLAFHTALVAATRNSRMSRMYATLAAEARICMANLETAYYRPEALVEEHQLIVDLLLGSDWDALEKGVHEHMDTAVHDLTRAMVDEQAEQSVLASPG
ncbi:MULTISPECIES: GntR family transcriptional regulator [Nocardiaceae]|uniref:Putative D-xylose utilization operon transcriptional repressor n=1 Tax=Rhodococcoides fascians TaxID=1828 RepID=A0A143QRF5_RHOFA|nr:MULTISPECIES: GntR family transcriptional regulator [Rhodococcus]MDP9639555.1 DNA-binding GntR family transcriptional regulator [Rhodococcus cercidiphylli]AMY25763.1 putative D-xylose utilization operon transcriptional repressor [Rhodococcus fascians]AMY55066.1 putative D-xylose utilization operon transcriptional repressor [Rhodococcus fascians D188]MDQ0283819.1 DNA-binding GntR family transcriptional regulator [Rhodococcus fascians]CAH0241124.1 putative D-xylose utilization operon transcri